MKRLRHDPVSLLEIVSDDAQAPEGPGTCHKVPGFSKILKVLSSSLGQLSWALACETVLPWGIIKRTVCDDRQWMSSTCCVVGLSYLPQ